MLTSIERKIEEIRQKPENIRRRYAIGMVAVVMLVVFGIWVIGLRESLGGGVASDAETVRDAFSPDPSSTPANPGYGTGDEELSLEEVFGTEGME